MAVRQYVGARYVPQFAEPIEWNANMSYEPMTVVTYLFNSYTSRKAVPVGIIPTNTEYWAPTGNYNAQVEAYRQEVVDLTETVNDNALIVTDFKKKVLPEDKFFLILGDSYGVVESNWVDKLFTLTGWNGVNFSHSGYGFVGGTSGATSYKTALSTYTGDKNTVTDIIVQGGLNDSSNNESEIVDAIRDFMTYVKSNFPNAEVSIAMCGWNCVEAKNLSRVLRAYQRSTYYGAKYLNGSEFWCHNSGYMRSDNFHPNETGSNYISMAFINAIKTGSFNPVFAGNLITPIPVDGIEISTLFINDLNRGTVLKTAGIWVITGTINLSTTPTLIATTESHYFTTPRAMNQASSTSVVAINGNNTYIVSIGFITYNGITGFYMWYTSNLTLATRTVLSQLEIIDLGV